MAGQCGTDAVQRWLRGVGACRKLLGEGKVGHCKHLSIHVVVCEKNSEKNSEQDDKSDVI
jgi:hypothetical protein